MKFKSDSIYNVNSFYYSIRNRPEAERLAYLEKELAERGGLTVPEWVVLEKLRKNGSLGEPREPKVSITIRIDADVIKWFKKDGSGWQTRINDALKLWVERYSIIEREK